jgi:membrane protein implicated in regulation of membrane protease activity
LVYVEKDSRTMSASILNDLFDNNLLNLIYAGSLFIGVIYAFFLMFFHGIGDALGDLDFNMDLDHPDLGDIDLIHVEGAHEATGVSMLAVASFVSSFGAFGLIAVTLFGAGTVASLIMALFGGLVLGIAAQVFFLYILSPTISSEIRQTKLIGIVAEITTPIPANGVGQIAFVAEGSRITYSARATDATEAVPRGTPVRIERIVGGMAYVSTINT